MTRRITEEEKKLLLSLEIGQLTYTKFLDLLSSKMSKAGGKITHTKSKFEPTDKIILKKGEYFNDKDIETTVGRFLFNKFIVEKDLIPTLGYINEPVNGGKLNHMDDLLSKALLRDDITVQQMITYLDHIQWLGMQLHTVICGSYTIQMLKPVPEMQKHRDKLLKENAEKIANGDVMASVRIEKECLDIAVKKIESDPGMDLFRSGARGSIGNNYKNISVMKGPVYNPAVGRFELVQSNFMEGIRKEELAVQGNAIVTGAYPKAIGTATSGYFSKQLTSALQAVVLDTEGSNCGTKHTIPHLLTDKNKQGFMQRYIVDKGKLILLDEKTVSSYINKEIQLRTPMMCANTKICSKCAGEMYYLLGVKNIGLTSSRAASTMLNMKMKKFHDATAKTTKIELKSMFL